MAAEAKVPPSPKAHTHKPLRLLDLPISPAKREAIDNTAHTHKKKGAFDSGRKSVFAGFETGVCLAGFH